MVSSSAQLLAALTLVGLADALVLDAAVRPPVRCSRVAALTAVESWYDAGTRLDGAPAASPAPAPPAAAVAVAEAPAEAAEEDDGQPQQTFDARDLLKEGDPDTDFMKWYRTEKAIEKYKKENPTNAIEEATRKLAGPLSTLAVIGFGFYIIPVVKGISSGITEAADEGANPVFSVLGNVANSVKNPTASVNEIEAGVSAKLPSVSLPSLPNPFGGSGGGGGGGAPAAPAVPAGVEPPIIPSLGEDLASIGKK